jgi:hypothetical protein
MDLADQARRIAIMPERKRFPSRIADNLRGAGLLVLVVPSKGYGIVSKQSLLFAMASGWSDVRKSRSFTLRLVTAINGQSKLSGRMAPLSASTRSTIIPPQLIG